MADEKYGSGYGKRPLWQWILLYVIIGGVIYAVVYYVFFAGKGYSSNGYSGSNSYQAPTSQPIPTQTQTQTQAQTEPTPSPAPQVPTPSSPQPMPASVSIANFAFSPGSISVIKGATVTWTNNDTVPHTVTSDTGAFASQMLQPGSSYSHTFNSTGTFAYHCTVHPSMHGSVTVTE